MNRHPTSRRPTAAALCTGLAVALLAAAAPAQVFVDADATGNDDGTSWAHAFPDLDGALAVATAGQQVWIAEGTYRPGVALDGGDARSVTFAIPDGVAIYGGFAGTETNLSQRVPALHPTVLDGDVGVASDAADDAYHVLVAIATGPQTLLDGVVVRHGRSDGAVAEPVSPRHGGALYLQDGTFTVRRCTFSDNLALVSGGAIWAQGSTLVVEDSLFTANTSPGIDTWPGAAGGLSASTTVATVRRCTFDGNTAGNGAAMIIGSSSGNVVQDCTFRDNLSTSLTGNAGAGAALTLSSTDGATIERCLFEDNVSVDSIGALSLLFSAGNVVESCVFRRNAGTIGGALNLHISEAVIRRSTFTDNTASVTGGAVAMLFSDPELTSCGFFGNHGGDGGALAIRGGQDEFQVVGSNPDVVNCVFSGNDGDDGGAVWANANSAPLFLHCTLYGNTASGRGGGLYTEEAGFLPAPLAPDLVLHNNVLWANADAGGADESAQIHHEDGSSTPLFNIIQGLTGGLGGFANLGADPLVVDADGADDVPGTEDDDLRLGAGSPAVDSGSNGGLIPDVADLDCDGDVRELLSLDFGKVRRAADDPAAADTGFGTPPVVDRGAHERGAWTHLGNALAGSRGEPCLVGAGNLTPGTMAVLELTNARESTVASFYLGVAPLFFPFKGGVMVPRPDLLFPGIPTGVEGRIVVAGVFPPGVPPGVQFWQQFWITDADAPVGFSASNGVVGISP